MGKTKKFEKTAKFHVLELITSALIPRAAVPIAISVLTPPAIPDLASIVPAVRQRIRTARIIGEMATIHSIRHIFAISRIESNSAVVSLPVIHALPCWFSGLGYHQVS